MVSTYRVVTQNGFEVCSEFKHAEQEALKADGFVSIIRVDFKDAFAAHPFQEITIAEYTK